VTPRLRAPAVRVSPLLRGETALRARREAREAARSAIREALVTVPLFVGVLMAYNSRHSWVPPEFTTPVRIATVVLLMVLGYAIAREIGRILAPILMGHLDAATAGTIGFLIRLVAVVAVLFVALRFSGIPPQTLAVGGAFTAVVVGLAAQQTLGNVFAGMVLISARPFRVGDRVRFQAGALAGQVEGTVQSLGLLYVVVSHGADVISVPNNVVISAAVIPLREPDAVDFRARLRTGVRPSDVQRLLHEHVTVATRSEPHIHLEELDEDEVIVRITATPVDETDGWRLADEVLAAVEQCTRDEVTLEHVVGKKDATQEHRAVQPN
jgi:small-conductance mechanosensitive channel